MISCKHKEGQCEPERSQITANGDECQGSLVMAQNWSLIYHCGCISSGCQGILPVMACFAAGFALVAGRH